MNTGQQLKMEALDHFEVTAQEYLKKAREQARKICAKKGEVCSDDIQEILPTPSGIHHNVAGAIFRKDFVRLGYCQTRRPQGRARMISRWRIK